jgi:hypothetical protein
MLFLNSLEKKRLLIISGTLICYLLNNDKGGRDMKKKNLSGSMFVMLCSIVLAVSLSSGGALMAQQHPAPAAVLATADGEQSDQRVEVTELKRTSGGTVNLKFAMVNDSNTEIQLYQDAFGAYGTISGVTLVDEKNKKKYFVVQDSENKYLCSSDLKRVKSKSRINLWAKFPAPPEDVEKISIVIPHFQPMDDVPISH